MAPNKPAPPDRPVLIDSDILIWYLRGRESAKAYLDSIPHSQRLLSSIVKMELSRGCRDKQELRRLQRFLETSFGALVHISEEVSRRAVSLVASYGLSHGITPDDALIAASALTMRASLGTANVADYRFIKRLQLLPFRP